MSFNETGYTEILPPPHLFPYFFPISSLKLFPPSCNQKSLKKPDTFDFKPSPPLYSPSSYHIPQLLMNRKAMKTVSI